MKSITFSILMAAASGVAAQSNLESVKDIYAKFGQGDVPGIIAKLGENVVWIHGANPVIVPYGGQRQGVAGATEFFQKLGQSAKITRFEPSNFSLTDNKVTNNILVEGISIATGKQFTENSVFCFEFDADGRVVRWEASGDFKSMETAFIQ
jgi:uncharacterized protein